MEYVHIILFFVYGIIFGSFFNVVGLRVPKQESIISPPSHCTKCERDLAPFELIPVFSYMFLKGTCKECGSQIGPIYPIMELVTGILFALSYYLLGFGMELIVALLFMSLLVIITVSDITYMLIPNKILLPFAILLLIGRLFSPLAPWWDTFLGATLGFGVLLLIALLSKGGMGGGDIKLFFVIGLVLGSYVTLLTLFLASIIGTVVGFFMIKRSGKSTRVPIPFGPSIAVAAVISYFWGDMILAWYRQFFV